MFPSANVQKKIDISKYIYIFACLYAKKTVPLQSQMIK